MPPMGGSTVPPWLLIFGFGCDDMIDALMVGGMDGMKIM